MGNVDYDSALEVLKLFETYATVNPRMAGDQHPDLDHLWIFETPAELARLPRLAIVYTIEDDEGTVTLWNLYWL